MSSLRLVFAGSPSAAVPSLLALADAGHDLAAVITRTNSAHGRARTMTATPVATVAEALGIPTIKANRLDVEATESVQSLQPDLGVIVAYGGLVREPLLSTPKHGWINLHFSLLPRWRGAAPVQHAIMAGDPVTGVTVFRLVEELDAGDILSRLEHPIGRHQTAGSLLESLAASGAGLLARVVDEIAAGTARAVPQTGQVTLAPKLSAADGALDWALDAESVTDRIRGLTPEPGAFSRADGGVLKILDAVVARDTMPLPAGQLALTGRRVLVGTSTHPVELVTVHPAGKRPMDAAAWWRGRQPGSSTVLR